jgi:hypothetical protein
MISERRKLRSKELHNLFSSTYITTVLKLRCIRWAENIARNKKLNIYVNYISEDTAVRYIVVYKGLYGVIILTVIKGSEGVTTHDVLCKTGTVCVK